jgi:hypothetical protein
VPETPAGPGDFEPAPGGDDLGEVIDDFAPAPGGDDLGEVIDDFAPAPGGDGLGEVIDDFAPAPGGDEPGSEVGLDITEPADSEDSEGPTGIDRVLVEQYGYSWVDGKAVAPTD